MQHTTKVKKVKKVHTNTCRFRAERRHLLGYGLLGSSSSRFLSDTRSSRKINSRAPHAYIGMYGASPRVPTVFSTTRVRATGYACPSVRPILPASGVQNEEVASRKNKSRFLNCSNLVEIVVFTPWFLKSVS